MSEEKNYKLSEEELGEVTGGEVVLPFADQKVVKSLDISKETGKNKKNVKTNGRPKSKERIVF